MVVRGWEKELKMINTKDTLKDLAFKVLNEINSFETLTIKFNTDVTRTFKDIKINKNDIVEFNNALTFTVNDDIIIIQDGCIICIVNWNEITTIKFN